MGDEYHTNNEYLKQIAGDETNEYHTNNEYLKQIAEQGGSGGGGVTEEKVIELIKASKQPKFYNYTDDGIIQTDVKYDDYNQYILSVQNNGEYGTYLFNRFVNDWMFLHSTDPAMENYIEINVNSEGVIITLSRTFDPEEGFDCTFYPLN